MNAFSVWVGLGASVGLWRVARGAPQRQVGEWVNAGIFVLFFSLIGARLSYVAMNWGYFTHHLPEALQIWLGGLTWIGAVAGAGLSLIYLGFQHRAARNRVTHTAHLPFGRLCDRLYPLLPPIAITAWLGSWQIGDAYGPAAPAGAFWGVPGLDESGAIGLRFPLQPLAALTLLVFFWVLEARSRPQRPAGRLSGLAVAGLLLNLLGASLLRADPAPYWRGLRVDTWFAIFYLTFFLAFVLINNLILRANRGSHFFHPERTSS